MVAKVIPGSTVETTEVMEFIMIECANCAIPFMMTKRLNKAYRESKESFYCPNGHAQGYYGKNEAERLKDKLEEERVRHERELNQANDKFLDALNEKTKLERKLKRVHKGTCPCCNRSFSNLKAHMESKHPELK
jgi:C4-dicarboxylate-specific signal transduction histidine kinase